MDGKRKTTSCTPHHFNSVRVTHPLGRTHSWGIREKMDSCKSHNGLLFVVTRDEHRADKQLKQGWYLKKNYSVILPFGQVAHQCNCHHFCNTVCPYDAKQYRHELRIIDQLRVIVHSDGHVVQSADRKQPRPLTARLAGPNEGQQAGTNIGDLQQRNLILEVLGKKVNKPRGTVNQLTILVIRNHRQHSLKTF